MNKRKRWTKAEDKFIFDNKDSMSNKELGESLSRSESAVAVRMNLKGWRRKVKPKKEPKFEDVIVPCPICGSIYSVGKVVTYISGRNAMPGFYCSGCYTEFLGDKTVLPPIPDEKVTNKDVVYDFLKRGILEPKEIAKRSGLKIGTIRSYKAEYKKEKGMIV